MGLYELMVVDDDIRGQILRSAESRLIRDLAREHGMHTLREAGWGKVAAGMSALEEVRAETQMEDVTVE